MTRRAKSKEQPQVALLLEVNRTRTAGDLGPSRASLPEDFRRRAAEIADSISEVADQFRTRLEHVMKPDEGNWGVDSIDIKFDITVQAEAGVLIAKASTGATFSAKLTLKAKPVTK